MLNESFNNFLVGKDDASREKFIDSVWDMLQRSYEKIGGLKGSGFSSKDDMLKNIPFWKLYVVNGKLIMGMFYKDKTGRKLVALGTDESSKSKSILTQAMKQSFTNSYGEYSKHILAFILRNISHDLIKSYIIPPEAVARVLKNETIIIPTDDDLKRLDPRDLTIYKRYQKLRPYMYVREIGSELFLKIMIGTIGKSIR
jgi:hypothetical protein